MDQLMRTDNEAPLTQHKIVSSPLRVDRRPKALLVRREDAYARWR